MAFILVVQINNSSVSADIFDRKIIDPIPLMSISLTPSCLHENKSVTFTPGTTSSYAPCAEERRQLSCPTNIYEVIFGSTGPVFLRRVSTITSRRCVNESKKFACTSCSKNSYCQTNFDESRYFVELDATKARVLKLFKAKIGLYCRCKFTNTTIASNNIFSNKHALKTY